MNSCYDRIQAKLASRNQNANNIVHPIVNWVPAVISKPRKQIITPIALITKMKRGTKSNYQTVQKHYKEPGKLRMWDQDETENPRIKMNSRN